MRKNYIWVVEELEHFKYRPKSYRWKARKLFHSRRDARKLARDLKRHNEYVKTRVKKYLSEDHVGFHSEFYR